MLGSRLKVMLADLGCTHGSAAKALHVTRRTIQHGVSGKTLVPYSAYLLLRIMGESELPSEGWQGQHM
jgi:plasmid maintenance system antidote protein VapI